MNPNLLTRIIASRSPCYFKAISRDFSLLSPTKCLRQQTRLLSVTPQSLIKRSPVQLSSADHDHVNHWNAERILAVALYGVIPAAFMYPGQIMDYALAASLVIHAHWGVHGITVDYIRPSLFGVTIPKVAIVFVYALSAFTLGGLCYFSYSDVGLVNAIKLLWKV